MGGIRWLTVFAPEGSEGVELVLEPNKFPPAREAQKTLYEADFPAAVLTTADMVAEYQRLKDLGVTFRGEPKNIGPEVSPAGDRAGNEFSNSGH